MLTKFNLCGIMEKERMFYKEAYAHQLAPQIIAKNSARSACFAISKGRSRTKNGRQEKQTTHSQTTARAVGMAKLYKMRVLCNFGGAYEMRLIDAKTAQNTTFCKSLKREGAWRTT